MSLTNITQTVFGNKAVRMFTADFGTSYTAGGISVQPGSIGFLGIDRVFASPVAGYAFNWDETSQTLKAYHAAPPIVYEEQHTIASNAITLDYPAAAILNIASATQSQMLIEPSDTLAANEVQLSAAMEWGVRPTLNFHASTSGAIKVTYITQAWKEVWDNRVASADFSTSTHVADLGDTICFIESCTALDTAGDVVNSLNKFVRGGDTATAGECEVDWSDSGATTAGDTTLTFAAADAVTDIKLTYISLPASGFLKNNFVEDEDLTMSSGTGASAYPILFPALCNQVPDYTGAGERDPHYLMMPEADAVGTAGEFAIDWHKIATVAGHQVRTEDTSSDAVSLTYVKGFPFEIPGIVPIEVKDGTDLSLFGGQIQCLAIGY